MFSDKTSLFACLISNDIALNTLRRWLCTNARPSNTNSTGFGFSLEGLIFVLTHCSSNPTIQLKTLRATRIYLVFIMLRERCIRRKLAYRRKNHEKITLLLSSIRKALCLSNRRYAGQFYHFTKDKCSRNALYIAVNARNSSLYITDCHKIHIIDTALCCKCRNQFLRCRYRRLILQCDTDKYNFITILFASSTISGISRQGRAPCSPVIQEHCLCLWYIRKTSRLCRSLSTKKIRVASYL